MNYIFDSSNYISEYLLALYYSYGSVCLYACERTGPAMWVPSGEYFVADRPRGAQPRGTVMNYLAFQRHQAERPAGYGLHRVNQVPPLRRHLTSVVRHGPSAAATGPRYNPIRPAPVRPAGTGTRKTITRRERRQKYREVSSQQPPMSTQTNASSSSPFPNSANTVHALPPTLSTTAPSSATSPKNSSMVFYNSNLNIAENKTYRISELNLSDSEIDNH